ncbi:MAG: RNA polymerase factor sigma-32 [Acidobacteriota bacterium]|nr:RNA polymerase factor sigma-32 [Acidobacteriota bacterium]
MKTDGTDEDLLENETAPPAAHADGEAPDAYDAYGDDDDGGSGNLDDAEGGVGGGEAPEPGAVTRYDPLHAYLAEIRKYAVLEREEEHELAERYRRTGDKEAAFRLVTANLKLVVKVAMIYQKVYRNILDLIQEGNLGLLQAVKRFDPERGTRLQTYAAWWIKAYILKFLLDNARMVKIGTTNDRRKILLKLNREKRALEAQGIVPTSKQLAEKLGVDEQDLVEVERGMSGGDVSLDAPVSPDGDAHYIDTLRQMEQGVDEKIAQGEFRDLLEKKFTDFSETLGERDRDILHRRLLADDPETLQEIADRYGVTREAVRVAEKKLVARLKEYMIKAFGGVREIEFQLSR